MTPQVKRQKPLRSRNQTGRETPWRIDELARGGFRAQNGRESSHPSFVFRGKSDSSPNQIGHRSVSIRTGFHELSGHIFSTVQTKSTTPNRPTQPPAENVSRRDAEPQRTRIPPLSASAALREILFPFRLLPKIAEPPSPSRPHLRPSAVPLPYANGVMPYSPGLCGLPHYPGSMPHCIPYPEWGCAVARPGGGSSQKAILADTPCGTTDNTTLRFPFRNQP